MELVFRYPTHQNKLVQYINSKSTRIIQAKLKKDHLPMPMHNFLAAYLSRHSEYLLIHKNLQKIVNSDLKIPLESFIERNPNNYNFPQTYF
jgi:DNA polymerase-3 subunit alpha (Gram-positive type)